MLSADRAPIDGLTKQLISIALSEDIGTGDLTGEALIPPAALGSAQLIAQERLIACGQDVAGEVFRAVSPALRYQPAVEDGVEVLSGTVLGEVHGPLVALLRGERTVLNFLQRLSGVATLTARLRMMISSYPVQLLDTRKTTPGWRALEKYAVRVGGGRNHRRGLFDAVLIKNNHIDALHGDIAGAVRRCREMVASDIEIAVEVRDDRELSLAIEARPDVILLDNMAPDEIRRSVQFVRSRLPAEVVELEASGGIDERNIVQYAETGVDRLSLGALTHSARAVKIALHYSGDASSDAAR